MCEVPCSCALFMGALALAVGFFAGRGKEIHLSEVPRTVDEELAQCPEWLVPTAPRRTISILQRLFHYNSSEASDFSLHGASWADDFFVAFHASAGPLPAPLLYRARVAADVEVPTKMASSPTFRLGRHSAVAFPEWDIDDPYSVVPEKFVPRIFKSTLLTPLSDCYLGALRKLPMDDAVESDANNSWGPLLSEGKYARKRDWVAAFYAPYFAMDGAPVFHAPANDLAAMFWRGGEWDDGLEKALAFDLIGAHRVRAIAGSELHGEGVAAAAAFVLRTGEAAGVKTREGFDLLGADMFFDAGGLPVLIETPEKRLVKRGDDDWQYWKWVWRSSLVAMVTIVDHWHLTHFRAANILARTARKTLPADHLLRRVLSVFTFGSIGAGRAAARALAGPGHALHRATPFEDFEVLSDLVPAELPSLSELHGALLRPEAFEALPARIREAPYFADGLLLVNALRRLVDGVVNASAGEHGCSSGGDRAVALDPHLSGFRNALVAQDAEAGGYTASVGGRSSAESLCAELRELLLAFIWTVTGFHRHVSAVGELLTDPDLASLAWKPGERFARPRQALLAASIAAFGTLPQPKLDEDFGHLFKGLAEEERISQIWVSFKAELRDVQAAIRQRDDERRVKNRHADPSIVECSAAV